MFPNYVFLMHRSLHTMYSVLTHMNTLILFYFILFCLFLIILILLNY